MSLSSKQNNVLELFLNEGTKHWRFKEIVKKAKISEDRANYWLNLFLKENIIKRVKPKGKMPYFIACFEHPNYKNRKKLFALNNLYKSGFLNYFQSLKAKAIVVFGSYSRADWYSNSDIDIFIVGENYELNIDKFELLLHREIQVHAFKNKKEIKKIRSGLINNVINGYFVKGSIQDIVEVSV